jgi:hypothetical protein
LQKKQKRWKNLLHRSVSKIRPLLSTMSVQNFTTRTDILQVNTRNYSMYVTEKYTNFGKFIVDIQYLREETMNELSKVKESFKCLEKESKHDFGKSEDERMLPNRQFSENVSSQLKDCLIPILDEVEKFKTIIADLADEIGKLRSHLFEKQNDDQTENYQATSVNLTIKPEKNLVDGVLLQKKNTSMEEDRRLVGSNHRILMEIKENKESTIFRTINCKTSGLYLTIAVTHYYFKCNLTVILMLGSIPNNGKSRVLLSSKERDADKLVVTLRFLPKHRVCFVYDERIALHRNVKQP